MRLTKMGHACVRLEKDGSVLVVDPGGLTEPEALRGADAVLVTHEHSDHFDERRLREALAAAPALQVWTNRSVAGQLDGLAGRVHTVGHGDTFTAAGFEVEVHGELHAVIHPDIPRITNIGFVVDGAVFHPGDALTVPERPVPTLLLPLHAPWSKVGEVIDYVRAVAPERSYALHDGLLNDAGLEITGRVVSNVAPSAGYRRLVPGESVDLG